MGILKWAAVAVTLLMGLANLGQIGATNVGLKIVGPILFIAAVVAAVGLVTRKSWGTRAVIAVGVVNLVAAVIGAIAGVEGWPIGLVLSGLAVVLAAVAAPGARAVVRP